MTGSRGGNPKVVAWVDHDQQSVDEVMNGVGSAKRNQKPDRKQVQEVFRFVPVIVQPSDDLSRRAHDAILEKCGRCPDLILVDLTYGLHDTEASIQTGRNLARDLLESLAPTPVGVYTRYPVSQFNKALLTSDGFAVVLDEIRHSYDGPSRLTGDQWSDLLDKVISGPKGISAATNKPARKVEAVLTDNAGGNVAISRVRGQVDVGIITIREDEFEAVLRRFRDRSTITDGKQFYDFARVASKENAELGVAMVRCPEQGQGVAQAVARDLIDDLDPKWLFLIGIAGGLPDSEYSLGDVVVATRLNDFAVSAALEGERLEFSITGGPMHQDVENVLAHLPALGTQLKSWNTKESIGQAKPQVTVDRNLHATEYYGNESWRKKVMESLAVNFPSGKQPRKPKYVTRPIISSNTLVKDTELAQQWRDVARHVAAVEMELGGVYLAARRGGQRDYRVLAVRGLSDIVGYKRNAEWTTFACHSAAAFAYALIVNGIIPASSSSNRKQASQSGQSPAKPTADRHRPESEPSDSLAIWREKLTYLESQEAIAADPAQKFALKKQLEEARKKIGELGGSC